MLPPHGRNLATGETFTVRVFRDHPEFDRLPKWWMLPPSLLRELAVAEYECDSSEGLDRIESQHPGCVFVY